MASLINIALGMNFNKGVLNTVVGDFNKISTSSNVASKAVSGFGDSLSKIGRVQTLAAAGNILNSVMGSLKGFRDEFKNQFNVLSGYAEAGDKIAKTSRLVGLSVHDYQAFSSAAKHSGMSIEEMDGALKKFNVNLGKAKSGDSKSLKMFDAILGGKSVSDFSNSSDLIAEIADGYQKLSSAEQKAFVSQELFGKGGQKISELFKDGGKSLKEYVDGYEAAFDEKGASNAEDFDDSLQDMRETIESVKVSVAQELFPAFRELFDYVKEFLKSSDGSAFKQNMKDIGKEIAGVVKDLLPTIPKILKGVMSFLNFIGPKVTLIGTVISSMVPIFVSIGMGISAITGIAVSTLVPVLGLIVSAVMLWGSVIKEIYDNWDMLVSFIVDDVWGSIKKTIGNVWDWFKSVFIDPFVNFFHVLPDIVSQAWEGFKNGVSQIGSFIYDSFFGAISGAINAAKGLLSNLPLVGSLFSDSSGSAYNSVSSAAASVSAPNSVSSAAASVIQQSSVTTTNRFAVDFGNVPQGTTITPPSSGDFDWSRSYTLAGAV